ncbi:hypothetical protein [Streptomyces humi]
MTFTAARSCSFADGTTTPRKIGDLAAGDAGRRGVTWTVDKFGGPVAYVDADRQIHLVPSGTATHALGAIETEVTSSIGGDPWWQWRGLLSKPAASWKATLTSKATGTVVRTLSGGEVSGSLTAQWDDRDGKGA